MRKMQVTENKDTGSLHNGRLSEVPIKKRTETPLTGPRMCLRTAHVSGPCPKCGVPMEPVVHSPLRIRGLFCGACCPCCAPAVPSAATSLPDAGAVPGSRWRYGWAVYSAEVPR
jgi:hypothetical protein